MEELTFRRLPDGTKETIRKEANKECKTMTQLFRDWVESLRKGG